MKKNIFKKIIFSAILLMNYATYGIVPCVAKEKKEISSVVQTTTGTATINSQRLIVLQGTAVVTTYSASIAQMGFTSAVQAQNYFNRYTSNLVSFSLNYQQSTVIITLYPSRLGSTAWTVAQWNNYFVQKNATFIN